MNRRLIQLIFLFSITIISITNHVFGAGTPTFSVTATQTATTTPTFTGTATPSNTATLSYSATDTPTATDSPTATPTSEMSTSTHTPTETPTGDVYFAWSDHFFGTPQAQPAGWRDESNDPSWDAELSYSTNTSYAVLTRTTQGTWGKALSRVFNTGSQEINVDIYPVLGIKVDDLSPTGKWKLVIQREEGDHKSWECQPETDILGTFLYNFQEATIEPGGNTPELQGFAKFSIGLVIAGDSHDYAEFDSVSLQRFGPSPSYTPTYTPTATSTPYINTTIDGKITHGIQYNMNGSDIIVWRDMPCVAWSQDVTEANPNTYSPRINVELYQDNEWLRIGSAIGDRTGNPKMAALGDDLYLAYAEYPLDLPRELVVRKYSGTPGTWTTLNMVEQNLGTNWRVNGEPDITFHDGQPVVVWANWSTEDGEHLVGVDQYNPVTMRWERLGDYLNKKDSKDPNAYHECVAYPFPRITNANGMLYVTWFEQYEMRSSLRQIKSRTFIKYFDGQQWRPVDEYESCPYPQIAGSSKGNIYTTWYQFDATSSDWRIYGRGWDQENNLLAQLDEALDMSVFPSLDSKHEDNPFKLPDITLVDETPYVIWEETQYILVDIPGSEEKEERKISVVHMKYFDGEHWVENEETLNADKTMSAFNPRIGSGYDKVYASWCENEWEPNLGNTLTHIYIKEYNALPKSPPKPYTHHVSTYARPNPFLPLKGQTTKFYFDQNETQDFHMQIMNLRGKIVRQWDGTADNDADMEWDGRDSQGSICEGGLYIYQIRSVGKRKSGTIVLLK